MMIIAVRILLAVVVTAIRATTEAIISSRKRMLLFVRFKFSIVDKLNGIGTNDP